MVVLVLGYALLRVAFLQPLEESLTEKSNGRDAQAYHVGRKQV